MTTPPLSCRVDRIITRLKAHLPTRRPHRPRRASLVTRTQLLVALSATLAITVSLAGLLATMRAWMIWQTDDALHSDLARLVETYNPQSTLAEQFTPKAELTAPIPGRDTHPNPEHHKREEHKKIKESEGMLLAIHRGTSGVGRDEAIIIQRFQAFLVPAEDLLTLQTPRAEAPHALRLPESGNYRVLTRSINGITFTVGRGTGDIADMLAWTGGSALAILLTTAGLVALISGRLVRRELQPLDNVVQTSRSVSRNLAGTQRPGTERVPTNIARKGSEIDDVAYALNALLDSVEESLEVKERSIEQLRQFVADASHELRTPLASIRGYTQLLEQGAITTPSALERISAESARMHDLVEDLLLLARLDAGRKLNSEPVDLLPIAIESLADANAAAPNHQWKLTLPDDVSDGCLVRGDEAALRQVIANLLANARHHTPQGTTVSLDIHHSAHDITIHVRDNGPGVPEDMRHSIFDRFVRAESSRSRDNGGSSGLGLAIVRALVEDMGGTVRLAQPSDTQTTNAQGAHFVVRFPKADS